MGCERQLKRTTVQVECDPENAQMIADKMNEFFRALAWRFTARVMREEENVCTVCLEAFEFDRFGACPHCGTPLGDV